MKLALNIINKMIQSRCSSSEIDFILYCSKVQNSFGQVKNLHYRDVCIALAISKQTFYNILSSLEKKNIIKVGWENTKLWDLTIINNIFLKPKDFKKGYLNTNRQFLYSPEFRKLRARAKILLLRLILNARDNSSVARKIKTIMGWVATKNKELALSYLEEIMPWFDILHKPGSNIVRLKPNSNFSWPASLDGAKQSSFIGRLKQWLHSWGISYLQKDLLDTYTLFNQYRSWRGIFTSALCTSILRYKSLEPRNINYLIQRRLADF